MKHFIILAAICLVTVGCQPPQQQVVVPQQHERTRTVIIEKPVQIHPQPSRPNVIIDINGHARCDSHNHCGHCDYCRQNGWQSAVGIYIRR